MKKTLLGKLGLVVKSLEFGTTLCFPIRVRISQQTNLTDPFSGERQRSIVSFLFDGTDGTLNLYEKVGFRDRLLFHVITESKTIPMVMYETILTDVSESTAIFEATHYK